MPQIVVTPWRHHSELVKVRAQFYPPPHAQEDERRNAVNLVGAWKLRGNLPHTVESTALLTDAMLNDEGTSSSSYSIRATYATAFCRFVTGLMDSNQTKGRKQSMYELAKQVGLPASFVELRHQATHEEIPPLLVLRQAASRSLQWLWRYYWCSIDVRSDILEGEDDVAEEGLIPIKDKFRELLRPHVKAQVEQAKLGKFSYRSNELSNKTYADICDRCLSICKKKQEDFRVLAGVLLETKFLVPSNRSLGSGMEAAFAMWDDFLKYLTGRERDFLSAVLEEMAAMLVQPSRLDIKIDAYREAVYLWLIHLLESDTWKARRRRCFSSVRSVIATCIMSPNHWTRRVSTRLVESGSQELKDEFGELVELQTIEMGEIEGGSKSNEEEKAAAYSNNYARLLEKETTDEDRVGNEDRRLKRQKTQPSLQNGWSKWDGPWLPKPIGVV
ncbi:Las1-domain-containing protein [Xylona heveae TC161]|uniref:Las1-domain-containing protein n=1 Tax=Xylona heveae (strain CBS 132557 / TC161) TaxID=1328760 RepID=A0A165JU42_XYLHT|nr:Las1-domain-containing protein [Xylona heveae TC161]KZF26631.1 Las1-domain-containing protein [Xylona heveae TC161]